MRLSPPHRTHRDRFVAWMVACLYLGGYLLTFAHFVEERHAPCAEHGAAHHLAESAEVAMSGAHDGMRIHQGSEVEDDHCELLQFFRSSTFVLNPSLALDLGSEKVETEPTSLSATAVRRADNSRWRFAPKQSPPAFA